MSQQNHFDSGNFPEHDDLDELLRSTKEELNSGVFAEPESFEPELPAEYADLVSEDEAELYEEEEERTGMPAVLKAILYVCLVLAAAVLLAVFAWKCADEVCALTAEETIVTVTVEEDSSISDITAMLEEKANNFLLSVWLSSGEAGKGKNGSLRCVADNTPERRPMTD